MDSLVKMSDNFYKIAKQEIQAELDSLQQILIQCYNDNDISSKGNEIEKHLHKIKGLAPMMGQNNVGEIAKINDSILKHIIQNGTQIGIHQVMIESLQIMQAIFNDTNKNDIEEFKNKILKTFSHILDQ
jgi:chemotaxis protein histidine kinase CheA